LIDREPKYIAYLSDAIPIIYKLNIDVNIPCKYKLFEENPKTIRMHNDESIYLGDC